MKIITKSVISIETLEVIEEESFEYYGQVALLKGGGSGGGSTSGKTDYPDYMKDFHGNVLGSGAIADDLTDVMDAAIGNSPWTAHSAYDPDSAISAYETAISDFSAILAGWDITSDWASYYAQALTTIDSAIDDEVDAYGDILDDEITTKILPRFNAGMRDINAVVSSAFPIGHSVIEGFRNRDVAKHASGLSANATSQYLEAAGQMFQAMMQHTSFEETYMKTMIEGMRIKIVAKKEQEEVDAAFDESDALWDLEVFQYGANMLAAISGGTAVPGQGKKPSTVQSMIGGALSGATAGAMVGAETGMVSGPVGAVIGGVLGGAAGLLS